MYCLHCKYTTKLRNDKEINALFASATHGGVAVSAAPTKQTCTNITILPQIAKNFWRKIFSHRLHRFSQIRRVWHPCHTHAATQISSHRIHGTHRNDWRRRKNPCTSVKSVGEYPPPEISVNSVNSVGEYPPPEASVNSVNSVGEYPPSEASVNSVKSVGGLVQTNLEWVLWKEFGGRRGYGRDAIPSYENSHRLHGCAQIRRQNAT